MDEADRHPRPVRFGVFEVDLRSGEVRKHGLKIKLQEQPFQILAMLLERPGEVVTREELRKKLWPEDTFVDFDNSLNTGINKIREALGDSADNPRFVETLPRRGYRFIYPVDVGAGLRPAHAVAPVSPPALWAAMRTSPLQLRIVALAAVTLVAVLAALVAFNVAGLRDRVLRAVGAGREPPLQIRSIAVLPLENLSGDPEQECFADGITDELITNLGKISALRVISRTSAMHYKGTKKRLPEIAKELNVDAIVEGTVQRSGGRVRITANLLHAPTDRHLWAESYERDLQDILVLQRDVAQAIAREVQVKLTPQEQTRLASVRLVDPEAYQAYVMGRYFWNKRTPEGLNTGLEYFEQALRHDPNYGSAFAGIADSYAVLAMYRAMAPTAGFAKAKAAAMKALEIDDSLTEPHATLGYVRWLNDWDWVGAEKEFKKALERNPSYATGHHWYSCFLATMGRSDEAIAEIRRAYDLDPASLIVNTELGWVHYMAGRYGQAIEYFKKTLEMDPDFQHANSDAGNAYREKGMYQEAAAAFEKAFALSKRDTASLARLGHVYAVWGKRREALKVLEDVRQLSSGGDGLAYEMALIWLGLGEKDKALTGLEKAFKDRHRGMVFLKVEPIFDPLRSDPRYKDLLRRMNFPP